MAVKNRRVGLNAVILENQGIQESSVSSQIENTCPTPKENIRNLHRLRVSEILADIRRLIDHLVNPDSVHPFACPFRMHFHAPFDP